MRRVSVRAVCAAASVSITSAIASFIAWSLRRPRRNYNPVLIWNNERRMKKKSRFLQTPIEPFAVEEGLTADQLLARMERISFQGRNLATAHRIWLKMLQDDVTIFMGMAGALSAGGLRLAVAHLISHRYIDCLVSTGANLYYDLHETRGQHHYVGSA